MNEFSKEEVLTYLDAAISEFREQLGDLIEAESEDGLAARRMLRAFADIRRRVEVSV